MEVKQISYTVIYNWSYEIWAAIIPILNSGYLLVLLLKLRLINLQEFIYTLHTYLFVLNDYDFMN